MYNKYNFETVLLVAAIVMHFDQGNSAHNNERKCSHLRH